MILKPITAPGTELLSPPDVARPGQKVKSEKPSKRWSPWIYVLLLIVLMIGLDRFFNPQAFPVQRITVDGELKQVSTQIVIEAGQTPGRG